MHVFEFFICLELLDNPLKASIPLCILLDLMNFKLLLKSYINHLQIITKLKSYSTCLLAVYMYVHMYIVNI